MDKYLMLINQLEKKISRLESKLKNVQNDISDKKKLVVSLKSKNVIDDNTISFNNLKIKDKKNIKNHNRKIMKAFMTTFLILFSLTAFILSLPNLITGTLAGLVVKLVASFGVWAGLVGSFYIGVKNSDKKYFDSIDIESLTKENEDLNTNINLREIEIETLTKKIEQLENLLDRIQNIIESKRVELSEIKSKRRTIIDEILGDLIEQRIAEPKPLVQESKRIALINK